MIEVSSDVPVRRLTLELVKPKWGEDHNVGSMDGGVDLIPGETLIIRVRGLKCGKIDRSIPWDVKTLRLVIHIYVSSEW